MVKVVPWPLMRNMSSRGITLRRWQYNNNCNVLNKKVYVKNEYAANDVMVAGHGRLLSVPFTSPIRGFRPMATYGHPCETYPTCMSPIDLMLKRFVLLLSFADNLRTKISKFAAWWDFCSLTLK